MKKSMKIATGVIAASLILQSGLPNIFSDLSKVFKNRAERRLLKSEIEYKMSKEDLEKTTYGSKFKNLWRIAEQVLSPTKAWAEEITPELIRGLFEEIARRSDWINVPGAVHGIGLVDYKLLLAHKEDPFKTKIFDLRSILKKEGKTKFTENVIIRTDGDRTIWLLDSGFTCVYEIKLIGKNAEDLSAVEQGTKISHILGEVKIPGLAVNKKGDVLVWHSGSKEIVLNLQADEKNRIQKTDGKNIADAIWITEDIYIFIGEGSRKIGIGSPSFGEFYKFYPLSETLSQWGEGYQLPIKPRFRKHKTKEGHITIALTAENWSHIHVFSFTEQEPFLVYEGRVKKQ